MFQCLIMFLIPLCGLCRIFCVSNVTKFSSRGTTKYFTQICEVQSDILKFFCVNLSCLQAVSTLESDFHKNRLVWLHKRIIQDMSTVYYRKDAFWKFNNAFHFQYFYNNEKKYFKKYRRLTIMHPNYLSAVHVSEWIDFFSIPMVVNCTVFVQLLLINLFRIIFWIYVDV